MALAGGALAATASMCASEAHAIGMTRAGGDSGGTSTSTASKPKPAAKPAAAKSSTPAKSAPSKSSARRTATADAAQTRNLERREGISHATPAQRSTPQKSTPAKSSAPKSTVSKPSASTQVKRDAAQARNLQKREGVQSTRRMRAIPVKPLESTQTKRDATQARNLQKREGIQSATVKKSSVSKPSVSTQAKRDAAQARNLQEREGVQSATVKKSSVSKPSVSTQAKRDAAQARNLQKREGVQSSRRMRAIPVKPLESTQTKRDATQARNLQKREGIQPTAAKTTAAKPALSSNRVTDAERTQTRNLEKLEGISSTVKKPSVSTQAKRDAAQARNLQKREGVQPTTKKPTAAKPALSTNRVTDAERTQTRNLEKLEGISSTGAKKSSASTEAKRDATQARNLQQREGVQSTTKKPTAAKPALSTNRVTDAERTQTRNLEKLDGISRKAGTPSAEAQAMKRLQGLRDAAQQRNLQKADGIDPASTHRDSLMQQAQQRRLEKADGIDRSVAPSKSAWDRILATQKHDIDHSLSVERQGEKSTAANELDSATRVHADGVKYDRAHREVENKVLSQLRKGPYGCIDGTYVSGWGGGVSVCTNGNHVSYVTMKASVGASKGLDVYVTEKPPTPGMKMGANLSANLIFAGVHLNGEINDKGGSGKVQANVLGAKGGGGDSTSDSAYKTGGADIYDLYTKAQKLDVTEPGKTFTQAQKKQFSQWMKDAEGKGLKRAGSAEAYVGYTWESLPAGAKRPSDAEGAKKWDAKHGKLLADMKAEDKRQNQQMVANYKKLHPGHAVPSTLRLSADTAARADGLDVEGDSYRRDAEWIEYARDQGFAPGDIIKELPAAQQSDKEFLVRKLLVSDTQWRASRDW